MSTETYEGKPCASGHTTRYRSNRKCVACSTVPVRYVLFEDGGSMQPIGVTEQLSTVEEWRANGWSSDIWRATKISD